MSQLQDPAAFLDEASRKDFKAFCLRTWPLLHGGGRLEWNWHHDAILYEMERIQSGTNQRLLVNLPPRSAKSIMISVLWVAWMLGRYPGLNFVCVSYSAELAHKLARQCQEIMLSALYKRLFPKTRIKRSRTASYDFETTQGGGRLATSPGGTLTGRGGDIIILDDPTKPTDAQSETLRNSSIDWYKTVLLSRLNDKRTGSMICVQQRLHEHDLSGVLLQGGGWAQLCLPAIATEDAIIPLTRGRRHHRKAGDLLHPERESQETLDQLRADMGSAAFEAQYQQNPLPAEGNLFKAEWLHYYPDDWEERGMVVQSWDTAMKVGEANDHSVCITARVFKKNVYIVDVYRKRLEFPDLVKAARRLATEHNAGTLLIEDKASGTQLIQELRARDYPRVPNPLARKVESDKVSRATGISSMVESGQLLLPRDAPWLETFLHELLAFPSSRYDDQVDALSQLMEWVRKGYRNDFTGGVGYFGPRVYYSDPEDWDY